MIKNRKGPSYRDWVSSAGEFFVFGLMVVGAIWIGGRMIVVIPQIIEQWA